MSEGKRKNSFLNLLNDLWSIVQGGNRKKNYFLLALLLLGIILMFASSFFIPAEKKSFDSTISTENTSEKSSTAYSYEEELVKSLQHVLENIDGISQVQIFINFAGSKESFYARVNEETNRQTTEQDREGGRREIYETSTKEDYILLRDSGGGEKPLLLRENMPEINGILVVAGGVENSLLQLKVVRAIQSVLNLPVHRIAVLPLGESKNIKR